MRLKTVFAGLMGLALLTGLSGCKSERESAYTNLISIMNKIVDRLSEIKSNTDLVDAKPDLQKLGAKMKDQMKTLEKLGEPKADEREALEKKYKSEREQVTDRLQKELERLAKDVGDSAPFEALSALSIDPMGMKGMSLD